ncbi:MAG: hypothetical protein NC218_06425 [Acetobacter sp.]|nr:hypothetical protein [Acetobacter sp.]
MHLAPQFIPLLLEPRTENEFVVDVARFFHRHCEGFSPWQSSGGEYVKACGFLFVDWWQRTGITLSCGVEQEIP